MNNKRRSKILHLVFELKLLRDNYNNEWLNRCIDVLNDVKYEEEESFENMPDALKYSIRGMDSEAAIDNIDEALGYLEEVPNMEDNIDREINIDMSIECLEDACI